MSKRFRCEYTILRFLGALLCVLGFASAVIVSALDKVGMRQLGLDGTIQEESRKVVRTLFSVITSPSNLQCLVECTQYILK